MVDGRDQNDHPCNRENIIDRAGKFAQRREKGFQQFIKMQPRIRLLAMFVPVMQCIAGLREGFFHSRFQYPFDGAAAERCSLRSK